MTDEQAGCVLVLLIIIVVDAIRIGRLKAKIRELESLLQQTQKLPILNILQYGEHR